MGINNSVNYTHDLYGGMQIPGPRINPNLLKELKVDEKNILFVEQ